MEVCSLSLSSWMLKFPSITKGVPSSGKVEGNKCNYLKEKLLESNIVLWFNPGLCQGHEV